MSMLPLDAHRRLHQRDDADDAARYRYLRKTMPHQIMCGLPCFPDGYRAPSPSGSENWPAGLDAAVDGLRFGDKRHANPGIPTPNGGKRYVPGRQVDPGPPAQPFVIVYGQDC